MSQRQWMGIGTHLSKIRNQYRARLLRSKLCTFMPRNGLPPPVVHILKLPRVLLVTTALVARAYKELLSSAARSSEEERYVRTYTKFRAGHTYTVADELINEKETTRQFRLSSHLARDLHIIQEWYRAANSQVVNVNLDVPIDLSRADAKRDVCQALNRWSLHFNVGIPYGRIQRFVHIGRRYFTPFPRKSRVLQLP